MLKKRGSPASGPGAAARAEAELVKRSGAQQLATVTGRRLQPPPRPLSEHRRAGRPTPHFFSIMPADAGGDGVSLGNPRVTGKNQGRNLVFTIDISCQIQDRYSGKIKKQRIGLRLRQIGKP